MFQEKTVGSFYLRAVQGWPLAMLWTLCRERPILQEEEEGERAGGSSTKGGHWLGCRTMTWQELRAKLSSQECSSKLLPCHAGCFERGRFGHAWEPLPPFMIGAACEEKLSFFPRAC